jgi:hypothetical protein|tara:strand:- start:175 stop:381 length:207 start_codon:yes stop_codon:yes gene_type:complete
MTITINEVEYDETTFNEEQTKLLNEVAFNYNLTRGKDHELLCLKYAGEQLIKQLEASLKDKQDGESVN